MSEVLHMYEIDEAGCVTHWAVAASPDEALRALLEVAEIEEPDDLTVTEMDDGRSWTIHYIDGWDFPDRPYEEVPPRATIETHPDRGYPLVTTTAGEWARFWTRGYIGCSEDAW